MYMECCSNWADYVVAIAAVAAGVISWVEYGLHRKRENSRVFSKLNKRYLQDEKVQAVVMYLSETGPKQEQPSDYQTELFLRFFEETYVYLSTGALPLETINTLYGYYLKQMYKLERGRELLAVCKYKDEEWPYIRKLREELSKVDSEWLEIEV